METADIKKLLTQSKKEPVNCAIGVNKNGEAAILLHKIKQPRALLSELEKEAGKLTTPAFGQALVDVDEDPKKVILTLNRAPSGISKRLKKALIGTGFTKVEIRNEDGSLAEADGADELPPEVTTDAASPQPHDLEPALAELMKRIPAAVTANAALAGPLKQLATAAVAAVRGQDMAAASTAVEALRQALADAKPAATIDLKALQAELGQLIRQIAGAAAGDMTRLDALKSLATTAAADVKAGAAAAEVSVKALRDALANAASSGSRQQARSAGPAPLAIWRDAKEAVDARIDALRKKVLEHPDEDLRSTLVQIADKGLNGVTDRASVGMMAAMMDAEAAPAKARQAVETFRSFLASDIARGIDENPFQIKVDLRDTLGAALEQIESRLAAVAA